MESASEAQTAKQSGQIMDARTPAPIPALPVPTPASALTIAEAGAKGAVEAVGTDAPVRVNAGVEELGAADVEAENAAAKQKVSADTAAKEEAAEGAATKAPAPISVPAPIIVQPPAPSPGYARVYNEEKVDMAWIESLRENEVAMRCVSTMQAHVRGNTLRKVVELLDFWGN